MGDATRLVRDALRTQRRAVGVAVTAGLLVSLSTVGLAATSAWLIVRAAQRPSVLSLSVPMGLVQLFALAKAAGRYWERTQTHRAALGAMGHVRSRVATDLEPLLPAGLGPRSADVVDSVLRDVERVQDLLTAVAGPLITSVAAGLVSVVVCGLMVPSTAVIVFAALVVDAVVLPLVAVRRGASSARELDDVHSELTALFDQVAQGGDEFIAVGALDTLHARLTTLDHRFDEASRRRRDVGGLVQAVGVGVNAMAGLAVATATVHALRTGQLPTALVAVPVLTALATLELVSVLSTSLVGGARDLAAVRRLCALRDRPHPVREPMTTTEAVGEDPGIACDELSFEYPGVVVLDHVTRTLSPGDAVVIDGPSGAGKTTWARLVVKFLEPSSGVVTLGGVDTTRLTSNQVRAEVGFVDDAPHVFDATLAQNLRVARPDARDVELEQALDAAGLGEYRRGLAAGLATRLGGARTGLSGGEQRRLGVARELLSGRAIAIFDEPTEGLDDESARALLASLRAHYRQGILVVISHRDATRLESARHWRLQGTTLCDVTPECAAHPVGAME